MAAQGSFCGKHEISTKKSGKRKDHSIAFENQQFDKRRRGKFPKHAVEDINSAEDLFTDSLTGKTYKEIKALQVEKDEIVRISQHKLIFVSKNHPAAKYKNQLNEAIIGLSEKTFSSKEPKVGIYRAIDFDDVRRELELMLRMQDKDVQDSDGAFLTENMRAYEADFESGSNVEDDKEMLDVGSNGLNI